MESVVSRNSHQLNSIPIILIILIAFSVTKVSGQSLDATYANTQCGISIQHPSNWKSEEINDDPGGVINYIVDLQPNDDEGFRNVVSIELDDISSLSDKSFTGIKDFEEETLSTQGDSSKIITSETSQVAGYPAQKIIYTEGLEGTPENDRSKLMKVILVTFDREYVIIYDASNSDYYDKHIATFEEMLNTLKISEPTFSGINC
jgi:hypothetical protein